jgi:hypothetical protein
MKPSEYPERLLNALVKGYNDSNNTKAREEGLEVPKILSYAGMEVDYIRSRITLEEIYDALGQLEKRNHIYESGRATGPLYKPTPEGIDHASRLMRPRYPKVWDYIKAHHIQLIIIILMIIAIILPLGFTYLNWW